MWKELCSCKPSDEIEDFDDDDEIELYHEHYIPEQVSTLEEAENLKSIAYTTDAYLPTPKDLYTHPGTQGNDAFFTVRCLMDFIIIIGNDPEATQTRIKEEYVDLFQHSAVSSFFAYLPIYFWKVVVDKTNERLREKKMKDVDIDELMKFLGILFYMSLVDKGKNITVLSRLGSHLNCHLNCLGGYEEYWGIQVDDVVLNSITPGNSFTPCMDDIMDLKRFKAFSSRILFDLLFF